MSAIITLVILWYIMYRLSKPNYEKRYGKKLKFRDAFKPRNWKKLH